MEDYQDDDDDYKDDDDKGYDDEDDKGYDNEDDGKGDLIYEDHH